MFMILICRFFHGSRFHLLDDTDGWQVIRCLRCERLYYVGE